MKFSKPDVRLVWRISWARSQRTRQMSVKRDKSREAYGGTYPTSVERSRLRETRRDDFEQLDRERVPERDDERLERGRPDAEEDDDVADQEPVEPVPDHVVQLGLGRDGQDEKGWMWGRTFEMMSRMSGMRSVRIETSRVGIRLVNVRAVAGWSLR
jgi:hypothetical protein